MNILAIETSCDETAAAIVRDGQETLSNVIASQIKMHAPYGGVVPELAAREHIKAIIPTIEKALKVARTPVAKIDALAVTKGPGLIGSLIVGTETARTLSYAWGKPIIGVNHLAGHIYANWLKKKEPPFPLVALLVSGGHSLLVFMRAHYQFEIIGETLDDSAGEAFDKVAQLIDLPYPGGPSIARVALRGDGKKYRFPLIDLTPSPGRNREGFLEYPVPSLDFSFSGLKTAVLSAVKKEKKLSQSQKDDIAASFQKTIVATINQNLERAIDAYSPRSLLLSGGVAANRLLRATLEETAARRKLPLFLPEGSYCTDNAAMIGAAAFYQFQTQKRFEPLKNIVPEPGLRLV